MILLSSNIMEKRSIYIFRMFLLCIMRGRTPFREGERSIRKNITMAEKDWKWLDNMIFEGRFASYSHAFRYFIGMYKRLIGVL